MIVATDASPNSCVVNRTNPNRREEQILIWKRSHWQEAVPMRLNRSARIHLTLTILTVCVVDVFSQGTRGLWYISNSDSTTLSYHPISSRVAMSKEGISTYIMCSCVSNLLQGGKSSFGVFKRRRVHRGILHLFNLFSISFFKMEATRFIYLNGQGPYLPMATLTFITLPPGKTSLTILPQESSILVT